MTSVRAGPSVTATKRNSVGAGAYLIFLLLLTLPVYALSRCAPRVDWRILVGVPGVASLFTYFAYRADKRRAELDEWRIPEATLHLGELLGGWPGAFLAQRKYRHKTAKVSFQLIFWIIVLFHEMIALDFLLKWQLSRTVLQWIRA